MNWTCTDSVVGTVGSKVVAARHAGDIEGIRGGNYSSSFGDGCRGNNGQSCRIAAEPWMVVDGGEQGSDVEGSTGDWKHYNGKN